MQHRPPSSPPQVTRVVFVPDSADVIASELRFMSAAVDVVFTAGGVGPTLDDVTMAGGGAGLQQGPRQVRGDLKCVDTCHMHRLSARPESVCCLLPVGPL